MSNGQLTADLKEFFAFVLDKKATINQLLDKYYGYHGYLNFGNQKVLYEKAKELLARSGVKMANDLEHRDVLDRNGQLKPEFVSRWCPGPAGLTLSQATYLGFQK